MQGIRNKLKRRKIIKRKKIKLGSLRLLLRELNSYTHSFWLTLYFFSTVVPSMMRRSLLGHSLLTVREFLK